MAVDARADRDPETGGSEDRRFRRLLSRLFAENELYAATDDPFEAQRVRVTAPVRRLFTTFGRRYWRSFGLGLTSGILARVVDLVPPVLLAVAIDAVFLNNREFSVAGIPTAILPESRVGQFWLTALLIGIAFLAASVFNWIRARQLNAFALAVQDDLRIETYDTIQRLNLSFFDEKQTGELMSVLSSNVNDLNSFLKDSVDQILTLFVTVGGVGLILVAINWQLAVVTMASTPVIAVLTHAYIRAVKPKYQAVRESLAELFSRLENNLTGIQVIKTSTTEDFERDRVAASSAEYRSRNWDVLRLSTVFGPAQQATAGATFVVTFVVGGLWVFSGPPWVFTGTLTVGEFVAFILLSQRFIAPMAQFGSIVDNYQRTHASAERVFGLLDETEALESDPLDAETLDEVDGDVVFDGVSFGYGDRSVLQDVSFQAKSGDTVALVGPSGSGKSTVLKLLPRLYRAEVGEIRIDDQRIDAISLRSLRSAFGYVGQDPFLFTGTVGENIAYGVPTASQDDIESAAKAANAHRFIDNLPDGYDTEVGQRGGKLSGGQRQRISIARAVLRDPEILILDEATSAVDTETELLIQTAIDRLTAGRTSFAIAHRLSTIRDADRILVFEDGEIVERGTHDTLIKAEGLYAHLWSVQAGLLDDVPSSFYERAMNRGAVVAGGESTIG